MYNMICFMKHFFRRDESFETSQVLKNYQGLLLILKLLNPSPDRASDLEQIAERLGLLGSSTSLTPSPHSSASLGRSSSSHEFLSGHDPPIYEVIRSMQKQLSPDMLQRYLEHWDALANFAKTTGGYLAYASACSGSGGDSLYLKALNECASELAQSGGKVPMRCQFVCEKNPAKLQWCIHFCQPEYAFRLIEDLAKDEALDEISCRLVSTGDMVQLFFFNFGFSCTDFSSLNMGAQEYRHDCCESGVGSSGVTWTCSLSFVQKNCPLILEIENVPFLIRSRNLDVVLKELATSGYSMAYGLATSSNHGFPHSRQRSWLWGFFTFGEPVRPWQETYAECMLQLRSSVPVPLKSFLFPDQSETLMTQLGNIKNTCASEKTTKWKGDHWLERSLLGMVRPTSLHQSAEVKGVIRENKLSTREADCVIFRYQKQEIAADASSSFSEDLKHNLKWLHGSSKQTGKKQNVVVGAKKKVFTCLLPTSKIMFYGNPLEIERNQDIGDLDGIISVSEVSGVDGDATVSEVEEDDTVEADAFKPRRLFGHEPLALQGVPLEHTLAWGMSERMAMHIAGNAFCAGPFSAVFISGMSSAPLPTHLWGSDPQLVQLPCREIGDAIGDEIGDDLDVLDDLDPLETDFGLFDMHDSPEAMSPERSSSETHVS